MIEQPELGKRILELRKASDITQEELKEKCYVSVRTIQRIESGLVTPRLSTIKILLVALGEDPEQWQSPSPTKSIGSQVKGLLLLDATEKQLKQAFQPSWIAGIIYLSLFLLSLGLSALPQESQFPIPTILVIIYVLTIISYAVFVRGFLAFAHLFDIQLLKISTYLSVIFVVVALLAKVSELVISSLAPFSGVISFFTLILVGSVSLIFGMALLKLQDGMGRLAKIAGRLEILFGLSYLSIVLTFIGLILLGPTLVFEIVLLFKADQQVKNGEL